KNSTFQFRYRRLKLRRGSKRTAVAVAHAQLIALYWVLRNGIPYQQRSRALQQQERESLIRHHLHRLPELSYNTAPGQGFTTNDNFRGKLLQHFAGACFRLLRVASCIWQEFGKLSFHRTSSTGETGTGTALPFRVMTTV